MPAAGPITTAPGQAPPLDGQGAAEALKNCGTGHGGFQAGNTCGAHGSGGGGGGGKPGGGNKPIGGGSSSLPELAEGRAALANDLTAKANADASADIDPATGGRLTRATYAVEIGPPRDAKEAKLLDQAAAKNAIAIVKREELHSRVEKSGSATLYHVGDAHAFTVLPTKDVDVHKPITRGEDRGREGVGPSFHDPKLYSEARLSGVPFVSVDHSNVARPVEGHKSFERAEKFVQAGLKADAREHAKTATEYQLVRDVRSANFVKDSGLGVQKESTVRVRVLVRDEPGKSIRFDPPLNTSARPPFPPTRGEPAMPVRPKANRAATSADLERRHAPAVPAGDVDFKVRSFDLKCEGKDGEPPRFSGHGAVFLNIDSVGDIIAPGAFAKDLDEFLSDGFIGGLNHSWDTPIARPIAAHEDSKGLHIETGDIVDTAHGRDVAKLMRAGIIRKLSIGFKVAERDEIDDPDEIETYWKSHGYQPSDVDRERAKKGVRLLKRIKLFEVSPVTVPANVLAQVTSMKADAIQPPVSGADWPAYSREVASAVGEFVRRAQRHAQNRFKVGRVLNRTNVDLLTSVADALESNVGQLREILARAEPKRIDEPAPAKAEGTEPETAAVTPARVEPAAPDTPVDDGTLADPAALPGQPDPAAQAAILHEIARLEATRMTLFGASVGSL